MIRQHSRRCFFKPLRSSYVSGGPGDKMLSVLDLDGAFVKSVTSSGLFTVQLADNSQGTVQVLTWRRWRWRAYR